LQQNTSCSKPNLQQINLGRESTAAQGAKSVCSKMPNKKEQQFRQVNDKAAAIQNHKQSELFHAKLQHEENNLGRESTADRGAVRDTQCCSN
jgi:hypothetical protein